MKKTIIFLTTLFLLSVGAFAQNKPDYSGEWTLDKAKSNLPKESRTESMTIKATQSAAEIKIEVATKMMHRPDEPDSIGGDGSQTRRVGRGVIGDGVTVYNLGGKETVVEVDSPAGKTPVKLQANFETDGKLNLSSTRTFKTMNGEVSAVTKETWELADGGKTLKVMREMKIPSGTNKTEMVFTKK